MILKKATAVLCTLVGLLHMASCSVPPAVSQSVVSDAAIATAPVRSVSVISLAPYPPVLTSVGANTLTGTPLVWSHYALPGKQPTQYAYDWLDGRHTLMAKAVSSASMLRQSVRIEPARLGHLNFSWKVPKLIPGADLAKRETHDSPVRVVLVFEGDRSGFSTKNAMLSELARAVTGEELPYATLMYVWCNACTPDSVITNPRTDRIREIVMESGPGQLGNWLDYQRDIRADYQRAFGELPGALLDVGMMTDTDNTKQTTVAWYGPIFLTE